MRLGSGNPAGRVGGPGERRAEHDRVGAAGDRLHDVAGLAHAAVGDDVHVAAAGLVEVVAARARDIRHRRRHGRVDAERRARGRGRAAAEADEHARRPVRMRVQGAVYVAAPPTITGTSSS